MKFSIITVCYNAATELEATMLSVLNQTHPEVEYIVIDGGSTDGSVDIIRKYADRLAYWVSEPDRGIYDAMNKALTHCTGQYVNFMNAGDRFASPDVLAQVAAQATADVVYGDWVIVAGGNQVIHQAGTVGRLWSGGQINHQSVFIKNDAERITYDLSYHITADYDLFCRMAVAYQWRFQHVDFPIAIFDAEGVSCTNFTKTQREIMAISQKYYKGLQYDIRRSLNSLSKKIRNSIKTILPSAATNLYRRIHNPRFQD